MISMSYACGCGYATRVLDAAIAHANTTRHSVRIHGEITPAPLSTVGKTGHDNNAIERARNAEILREAARRKLL